MEEKLDTPQLNARLLNACSNDFGDDMVPLVVGIGEVHRRSFLSFLPGSQFWLNGTKLVAQAPWRNENHSLGFPIGGIPDWKIIIDGWQSVHNEVRTMPGLADGITQPALGAWRTYRSSTPAVRWTGSKPWVAGSASLAAGATSRAPRSGPARRSA